jgi:LysR family transcriptional regulator, transcriptional activator of the cysJI operon
MPAGGEDWMDFVNLKTLIESAKLGSFSKAASSLCVTQSAVSRRIKLLEDHYGELLLDRSGPVLKPTAAGESLIEKARQVLTIEEDFIREMKTWCPKKKISFCCTVPFGIAYLPDIFREFMCRNAEQCDLNFVFEMPETALEGLKKHLFDMVLIEDCEDLDLSGFSVFNLPDDEMVFVSSPLLGLNPAVVDIEEIFRQRFYCKKNSCCARRFLDKSMKAIGRDVKNFSNTVFFDDIPFIVRAVMAGDGITFASRSIVAEYLRNGTLIAHHIDGFDHTRPRRLVLNDKRNLDPVLLDFIKGIFTTFDLSPPESLVAP